MYLVLKEVSEVFAPHQQNSGKPFAFTLGHTNMFRLPKFSFETAVRHVPGAVLTLDAYQEHLACGNFLIELPGLDGESDEQENPAEKIVCVAV